METPLLKECVENGDQFSVGRNTIKNKLFIVSKARIRNTVRV